MLRVWRSKSYQPGTLGRSLALGMVIGFSPTVGAQVVICLMVCFVWNRLLRAQISMPAALVGSMVVNPITMGPTYFVYYKIGCLAVDCHGPVDSGTFASLGNITELGWTVMLSLWVGGILFMLAAIPLGFYLGRRVETFLENRRKRRPRALTYAADGKQASSGVVR